MIDKNIKLTIKVPKRARRFRHYRRIVESKDLSSDSTIISNFSHLRRLNIKRRSRFLMGGQELDTLGKDFIDYYDKKFYKKHLLIPPKLANKIMGRFFEMLSDMIISSRSGVYLEGMGYFFVFTHPFKISSKLTYMKKHRLVFVPTKNSPFKNYTLDWSFSRNMNTRLRKSIAKGYRYLNMLPAIMDKLHIGVRGFKESRNLASNNPPKIKG